MTNFTASAQATILCNEFENLLLELLPHLIVTIELIPQKIHALDDQII